MNSNNPTFACKASSMVSPLPPWTYCIEPPRHQHHTSTHDCPTTTTPSPTGLPRQPTHLMDSAHIAYHKCPLYLICYILLLLCNKEFKILSLSQGLIYIVYTLSYYLPNKKHKHTPQPPYTPITRIHTTCILILRSLTCLSLNHPPPGSAPSQTPYKYLIPSTTPTMQPHKTNHYFTH